MNAAAATDEDTSCAFCSNAEGDKIKLVPCDDCDLVRYCSVKCQEDHRQKHEKECKQRAAELHDEILFRQPESRHDGDCPICLLPLPIDPQESTMATCCSNRICDGCNYANQRRGVERRLQPTCPICRTVVPKTDKEAIYSRSR